MIDGFKTSVPLQLRFCDTDALGHVNNARYLEYLELARIEYLKKCFGVTKTGEFDVIVARIEIDYKSPLLPHEAADCGIRVERIGGASFDFGYRIEERQAGRLIALAKSVMVCFDYKAGRVKKIDEQTVRKMREYDGIA